jgi:hypothetical protein
MVRAISTDPFFQLRPRGAQALLFHAVRSNEKGASERLFSLA